MTWLTVVNIIGIFVIFVMLRKGLVKFMGLLSPSKVLIEHIQKWDGKGE